MTGLVDELESLIPFLESHHCSAEPIRKAVAQMTPVSPDKDEVDRVARKLAAQKMGLRKDVNGENLPDELWSQCIFDAEAAIAVMSPVADKDEVERMVEFAWTATEGYKHFPPYVNIVGNRIAVRGQEQHNGEYYEYGDYVAVELPDHAMAELRAAMTPVDRLREALEAAQQFICEKFCGCSPDDREHIEKCDELRAALSSPEPVGEVSDDWT